MTRQYEREERPIVGKPTCVHNDALQESHIRIHSISTAMKAIPGFVLLLLDEAESLVSTNAQQRSFWRRLTGWIAIHALVLQTILVAAAAPHVAASASDVIAAGHSGHELCLHDAGESDEMPAGVPAGHDGNIHCPFCVAGGSPFPLPARLSLPAFVIVVADAAFRPTAGIRVASTFQYSPKRSRAPPVTA